MPPRLFSYRIPTDDGAAPNPFWKICTLVICKPAIRRVAERGDWVAGTGSKNSPVGNVEGQLVYAMRVTDKVSLADYDRVCRIAFPNKIPEWTAGERERRVGDCIYDFSVSPPRQRRGVHTEANRARDLGGRFALVSNDFYYFGRSPVLLPAALLPIVKRGQGHKSNENDDLVETFVRWIREHERGVHAQPQTWTANDIGVACGGCRALEDELDDAADCLDA